MAGERNCVRLLCFCSVVLFLLLADVAAAHDQHQQRETVVVGSTQELHLRGNTVASPENVFAEQEVEESFEEFERRELVDQYPTDPADPNCSNDPTLCAP